MDMATEIRKLPPSNLRELSRILELNDSWKILMDRIPKVLERGSYECKLNKNNLHKYRSEHFSKKTRRRRANSSDGGVLNNVEQKMADYKFNANCATDDSRLIEHESKRTAKSCTEILFDEWGTSGKVRPALGHLLFLLTTAQLFRAADYVAVQLLNVQPPARPTEGPAALVTVTLRDMPDPCLEEVERILDAIDYPSSVISNLTLNSYDANLNYDTADTHVHVIPKIVVSEIPVVNRNEASIVVPVVTENRRRRMNRQNASVVGDTTDVSDMIKFSQSQISSDSSISEGENVPNISALMSLNSENQSQLDNADSMPQDFNSNSLPALSALNVADGEAAHSEQDVPAISQLLSGNVPSISGLLGNSEELNGNENQNTSEVIMPNLSILNADQQNGLIPQMSLLFNGSSTEDLTDKKPQVIINVVQPEESTSIPQLSALLSDQKSLSNSSSKHFLPILDHMGDIPSETSSFASSKNASSEVSHNSNLSQRSDLSRGSRPMCTSPLPNLSLNTQLPHFAYPEIEAATNIFDETPHMNCRQVENQLAKTNGRFLGSGAFGSVFLALELNERPVAVKRLFLNNVDVVNVDDTVTKQFRNEVEVLSKYKHENLLSLIGYSCDGPTYCLVYEFMPGGALKDRLQSLEEKLIWTDRLYIALGTARAVSYLHTAYSTPLIHRDIKTANILLDCTNKPKLCDFGLIKLIHNQNTNTSTTAFGTSAYMAREAFRGDVSVKLDTFSFGVVLLELITGLPPLDENREGYDIVTHVEEVCEDNSGISPLIDTKAGSWVANSINFAEELYNISSKCLEENKKKRPTMVEVTENLAELIKKSA